MFDLEPTKARLELMSAGRSWGSSRIDGVFTRDVVVDVAALIAEVERMRTALQTILDRVGRADDDRPAEEILHDLWRGAQLTASRALNP